MKRLPLLSILALPALLACSTPAPAADPAPVVTAPQAPDARPILDAMARRLGAQERFSVFVKCGYDAVQESGRKLEFMEQRRILVDRPGRMRVDIERSDGNRSVVLIDGRTVTALDRTQNAYAQVDAKPNLDETIVSFVRDLKMRLPLAMLMLSRLEAELSERLVEAVYVERTSILGEPTDHIAGSTDSVDFQIWIAAGKDPLPRRVVLTYRNEPGEPQFRAALEDWDLSPRVRDSDFEFDAPKGAARIPFVVQTAAAAAPARPATDGAAQ